MKRVIIGCIVIAALVSGILMLADKITMASPDSETLRKMGEVLDNQKLILNKLESLKEELNIIKIRITQQQ